MVATEVTVLDIPLNDAATGGVAIDAVNGNKYVYSQTTCAIFYNFEATDAFTITVTTATADSKGFTKTITKSVAAGSFEILNFLSEEFQSGGYVNVSYGGTGTDGKIVVARLQKGN